MNVDALMRTLQSMTGRSAAAADFDVLRDALKQGVVELNYADNGAINNSGIIKDSFVVTLTNGASFKYEGATADELSSLFEQYLNPSPPITVPQPSALDSGRLHYTSGHLFLGREAEVSRLHEFMASTKVFIWWALTGGAGIGKSTLAFRLGQKCAEDWHFGFLRRDEGNFSWANWRPRKNTLIIVDYVRTRVSHVGDILEVLQQRSGELKNCVRVLIVERAIDEDLRQRMVWGGTRQLTIDSASFHSKPLRLSPLSDDALWSIIADTLKSKGETLPAKQTTLERLRRVDDVGSPLMARLFAEALATQKSIARLDATQLARAQLDRDSSHWNYNLKDRHRRPNLNVVALASVVGGIRLERLSSLPQIGKYLPDEASYDPDAIYQMTGHEATEEVSSIQPNLVGELLALDQLRPTSEFDKSRTRAMISTAWSQFPSETGDFVARAVDDFPQHPTISYFLAAPETPLSADHEVEIVGRLTSLSSAIVKFTELGDVALAEGAHKQFETLYPHHIDVFGIVPLAIECGANLVRTYCTSGLIDKAETLFHKLTAMVTDQNRRLTGMSIIGAGEGLIELYLKDGHPGKAAALYWNLKSQSDCGGTIFPCAEIFAEAAVHLIGHFHEAGKSEEVFAILDDLVEAPDSQINRAFARGVSVNLSWGISMALRGKNYARLRRFYQIQRELVKRFPYAEEICHWRAQSALITYHTALSLENERSTITATIADGDVKELQDLISRNMKVTDLKYLSEKQVNILREGTTMASLALLADSIIRQDSANAIAHWEGLRGSMVEGSIVDASGYLDKIFSDGLDITMRFVYSICPKAEEIPNERRLAYTRAVEAVADIFEETLRFLGGRSVSEMGSMFLMLSALQLNKSLRQVDQYDRADRLIDSWGYFVESTGRLRVQAEKTGRSLAEAKVAMQGFKS